MFKDYYEILDISPSVSQSEIRTAFKKQSLKWHPDRNPGKDTTSKMQDINEAYLILKDDEARKKYDREFLRFKKHKSEANKHAEGYSSKTYQNTEKSNYEEGKDEFTFEDETLKKWMENARRQAVELAKQSVADLKGMIEVGTKEAAKDAGLYLLFSIVVGAIILLIVSLKSN